jgi:mono/diheme cytochrome c family protein
MARRSLIRSAAGQLAGLILVIVGLAWVLAVGVSVSAQEGRGSAPPADAPAASTAETKETYASVYNGWKWWHVYCYRCHGTNAANATLAPNLLEENHRLARSAFLRVVRTGRDKKGMPEFSNLLDAKQMNDLFVYVRARADKVLPAGRPDEVGPPPGMPWTPPDGWTPK